MFGFPVNLQDSGVQKFTNDADNGFPKIQQREVFYSVKDGIWTDRTIWQTASGRVGLLPTQFDDVYIRNDVQITGVAATYRINNLNISNRLSIRGNVGEVITIQVFNKLSGEGTLDIASISSTGYLSLLGNDHTIKTIVQNANSIVDYAGSNDQQLMDIPYQNLYFTGRGIKTPKNNLVVNNQLRLVGSSQFVELSYFNLSVFGVTNMFGGNSLRKSHYGNVLFVGLLNVATSPSTIDFSQGNPDVECRGGITTGVSNNGNEVKSGTGTWRFTTNNQSIISWNFPLVWDAPILIDNITLTLQGQAGADGGLAINAPINGTTGTSQLLMGATGVLNFNSLSSVSSMTTGIWNFTTNNNKIGYTGNYTATIPSYFTTFHNLNISGTGTKSLGVNTTLNGNFIQSGSGAVFSTFEMGSYNFFVNGSTQLIGQGGQTSLLFRKSGSGNITFVGELRNDGNNSNTLDFSGNPNVECRGGMNLGPYGWGGFNTGTGTWTFSTNNQQISGSYNVTNFSGPVLISGAITLTITSGGGISLYVNILNSINGNNANSKLFVGGGSTLIAYLGIATTTPIMSTGIFDFTTSTLAGISFRMATAYSIPYNNFQHLEVANTGKKSLSANTTIQQTFLVNSEFDALTYDLTINGATTLNASTSSIFRKTGVGNIIFGGLLQAATQSTSIDFSGNPNVEFKNGFNQGANVYTTFNTGIGIWKFSTNNQSLGGSFFQQTLNCQILISGGITLTLISQFNNGPIFTNTINGDNAASKLLMNALSILTHQSATQPMITGILDTSTNLNTWIYGSGNQDIKGGPTTGAKQVYRNLTLNGGGTKTLQGFVSVLNTYTLTSPATLNNNGFTLTNP